MTGVKNFLQFLNENWTTIVVIIGLCIALIEKVRSYLSLSKEEKINAAIDLIQPELLKIMSEAEIDWQNYKKSGELKKSQVIQKIYSEFPILKEYVDQDELIALITDMIDDEKEKMDEIINKVVTSKETKEE